MSVGSAPLNHAQVVRLAVADICARFAHAADPGHLPGDEFTMLDLQRLFEMILGFEMAKDAFQRRILRALDATENRVSETGWAGAAVPPG